MSELWNSLTCPLHFSTADIIEGMKKMRRVKCELSREVQKWEKIFKILHWSETSCVFYGLLVFVVSTLIQVLEECSIQVFVTLGGYKVHTPAISVFICVTHYLSSQSHSPVSPLRMCMDLCSELKHFLYVSCVFEERVDDENPAAVKNLVALYDAFGVWRPPSLLLRISSPSLSSTSLSFPLLDFTSRCICPSVSRHGIASQSACRRCWGSCSSSCPGWAALERARLRCGWS